MNGGRSEWSAFYYDGRTAQRVPVTLTLSRYALHLRRQDGTVTAWPFDELRQTQGRMPGERLRIEFGADPAEALVVEEPGLADAIRRMSPDANPTLRGRLNTARVIGWSIFALAMAAALYVWAVPAAATWMAPKIPAQWEAALGEDVADRLASANRACGDSSSMVQLRTVLDRLLDAGPKTPYEFKLVVLKDNSVNAFAAPGGFIAVNKGLLQAARTPEELAGVLAHEIQHVTQRHATRAILREVPLRLALAAMSGGSGTETAVAVAANLGALRYRRGDEAEADREGMRLMQAAEIDPAGMVSFMRTLETRRERAPRLVTYFSSHPRTADRVAELESMVRQQGYVAKPLLDSAAWAQVRGMCRS